MPGSTFGGGEPGEILAAKRVEEAGYYSAGGAGFIDFQESSEGASEAPNSVGGHR